MLSFVKRLAQATERRTDDSETRWAARPSPWLLRAATPLVRALSLQHPITIDGTANLPKGPALLVGNHGLFGYETPFFFERLLALRGNVPIGLADRGFFRVPGVRDLLVRLGGTFGNSANGLRALQQGNLVVCYPGGVREVYKQQHEKYKLLWKERDGFVRLALSAGVPIVPFAAAGVDHPFNIVAHLPGTGALLMGSPKYNVPLAWGSRGPMPEPAPFWFRFGKPIETLKESAPHDSARVRDLHALVWERAQVLLDGLMDEWAQKFADQRSAE